MGSVSKEILHDVPPYIRTYTDGTVERLVGTELIPPITTAGVTSKDVLISPQTGLSARLFRPPLATANEKLPLVIYFHGGAFVIASPAEPKYHHSVASLASHSRAVAVSVDYRLAPEHPFPTALHDSLSALRWVLSHAPAGSEFVPGSEPEPVSESKPGSEPVTESEFESKPGCEPKFKSKPGSEPTFESKPGFEPVSESKPGFEPVSESELGSEPKFKSKPGSEPTSESKPGSEPVSELGSEPEFEAKPGSEPASKFKPGSGSEEWLKQNVDFNRVFLAGDSAGATIAHHLAIWVGSKPDQTPGWSTRPDQTQVRSKPGETPGWPTQPDQELGWPTRPDLEMSFKISGMILINPYFWGKEPIGSEKTDHGRKAMVDKWWEFVCPAGSGRGSDDPLINPFVDGAPGLERLGSGRVVVTVSEKDILRDRGWAYYEGLVKSDWKGKVEMVEVEGEDHVFHIFDPNGKKALDLMKKLSEFINVELNE